MIWVNCLGQLLQSVSLNMKARRRVRRLANQYRDRSAQRQCREIQRMNQSTVSLSETDQNSARATSQRLVDSVFDNLNRKEGSHDR